MGPGLRSLVDTALLPAVVRLAHAGDTDPGPQRPLELVPSGPSGRLTFSHVNVVIPSLPEPHRYLACMVLVGHTGTRVFDDDRAVHGSPRRTATATVGTATTGDDAYRGYRLGDDADLRPGRWRLGDGFELTGSFPQYAVRLRRRGLAADLAVRCDGPVTWFARSPIYDHVGYPARAVGTVGDVAVDAACSLEYARATSTHLLVDRVTPPALKLPWDLFCYQILDVGDGALLLLTWVGVAGAPAFSSVIRWRRGALPERRSRGIDLEVLEHHPDRPPHPSGASGPVATRCRWRWDDGEVELRCDTPLHPGVGTGWIAGWSFAGTDRGRPLAGRAYGEWADRRKAG